MKTNKGITLIALVITIIVLIILAGISIAMVVGDDGIITKAEKAKSDTNKAQVIEEIQLKVADNQMDNSMNLYEDEFIAILEEHGELSGTGDILDQILTTKDEIKIKVSEIYDGEFDEREPATANVSLTASTTYLQLSLEATVSEYTGNKELSELHYSYYKKSTSDTEYVLMDSGINMTTYETTLDEGQYTIKVEIRESEDGSVISEKTETIELVAPVTCDVSLTISTSYGLKITPTVSNYTGDLELSELHYSYYLQGSSDTDYVLKTSGVNITTYTTYPTTGTYNIKVEIRESESADYIGVATTSKYYTEPACFVAGTQVLTESGMKNIEDIEVGEKVYSINLENNQRELKEVTSLYTGRTSVIFKLTIGDQIIETTPRHQFYIVDKGWIRAYELEEGDKIVAKDNSNIVIEKIEVQNLEEPRLIYNLTVEGYHNYLITQYELLVHNAGSK